MAKCITKDAKFTQRLIQHRNRIFQLQEELLRRLSYLGCGCYDCECPEWGEKDDEFTCMEDGADMPTHFCLTCGGYREY